VSVEQQIRQLIPSRVALRYDPGLRRLTGTTKNVRRLAVDLAHFAPGDALTVEIDNQKLPPIPWPGDAVKRVDLQRSEGTWKSARPLNASAKRPDRNGVFKDAFRNDVLFVVGTSGTADETAWAYNKARYDAETFWYRGNGSIEIVTDVAFDIARRGQDRNVVLYGHSDSNSQWRRLLDDEVIVARGMIRAGGHELRGEDLACLMIRPRRGSDVASVGVVAGTGLEGMRTADRLPYFVSGVAYPDLTVVGADSATKGGAGIRAAGFFGQDWTVEAGEFAWRGGASRTRSAAGE
jgi:hypothetical protein